MIANAWQGFDFGLGPDIDMLRDTARGFAQDKIAPRAGEIDKTNKFPRDLWPRQSRGWPAPSPAWKCLIGLRAAVHWLACLCQDAYIGGMAMLSGICDTGGRPDSLSG